MMELPNYSSQLMQQLYTLRKEGHFCDCTILVGDVPHRAHKLVLAASSMLFRSLLEGSDTISIDTAVVSSQEFGCLLDMVYTGKLPLGKHNVSRIVAAADNLQMFDVAVGFKNVLTSLVNQQPPVQIVSTQTSNLSAIKAKSVNPVSSTSPTKADFKSDQMEVKAEQKKKKCQGDCDNAEGPPCKKVILEQSQSSGSENAKSSVRASSESATCLLERSSVLVELLTNMSSILELLRKAAQSSLDEQQRQVVCECCKEADPSAALEKLMSGVKEGQLSEAGLFKLLQTLRQNASSSFPPLLVALLEEVGRSTEEVGRSTEEVGRSTEEVGRSTEEVGRSTEEVGRSTQETTRDQTAVVTEKQTSSRSEDKQREEGEEANGKKEIEDDDKNVNATTDSSSPPPSSSSSPSKPYPCRWCRKGFAYKCRMLAHEKRCSMSQEFVQQCPQCPKKLANQRALQRHLAEAHRNTARAKKKVACDLCGRTFAHPSGMIYHKRTEHFEEKPFACEECGAKFGANSSLKNHMRLHTGEKPYHCKHCDMTFSVAAALAYHTKKKHSEGKMYVCQYCKAIFAQSIELTRHVRTHTGDRPYVCRECGKGYSQASGLTVHLHTFHNLSEPHDCQKCCLSFSTLEEHRQHIQEFHPKEFHKCPVCSKVFTSSTLLDKHKVTHTGTKPFSCDICSKSYQQLSGLWYHNRTNHPDVFASHTRQLKTLVQCDVCFKFFPSAASVAKHQAADHQGSAAMLVHCAYCPVVMSEEEEMQEHISSQHAGQSSETLSCPLCSLVSTSQLELQEHLLSCHMETQVEQEEAGEEQEEAGEEQEEAGEEKASASHTTISAGDEEVQSGVSEEQAQLPAAQQVYVTLAGGRCAGSAAEVVEVNMFDLINSSVTFICEDKSSARDS